MPASRHTSSTVIPSGMLLPAPCSARPADAGGQSHRQGAQTRARTAYNDGRAPNTRSALHAPRSATVSTGGPAPTVKLAAAASAACSGRAPRASLIPNSSHARAPTAS